MLKNILSLAGALLFGALMLQSCDGYKTTDNGLKYKIHVDSAGENIEAGGVALVHLKYFNEKDTFDTYKLNYGQPIDILVPESAFKGSLEEGLLLLSPGDSATFFIRTDSLYIKRFNQEVPSEIKEGSMTTFHVKVDKVYGKKEVDDQRAQYKQRMDDMKQQQMSMVQDYMKKMLDSAHVKQSIKNDAAVIEKKLKADNVKAEKTEHGVYYAIHKDAQTDNANIGDTAMVHYTGRLFDGTVFDSSQGRDPLQVVIGVGRVIPGWDMILQKLGEGDKATVYIPSALAYGKSGIPDPRNPEKFMIPKNSPLIFDIEVVEVKK
ncbi:MAG: FKBP-type peptidyl-prolyl cis-trans isomerase [Cytophagaceae bacterium]